MPDPLSLATTNGESSLHLITNGIEHTGNLIHDSIEERETSRHNSRSLENGPTSEHPDAPPTKKRRLAEESDSHKSSPRLVSPPWKSVHAEGPTSFLDNGKRRSGRTNAVPLELQVQPGRRQTRAAHDKASDKQPRPAHNVNGRPKPEPGRPQVDSVNGKTPSRGPGRPPKKQAKAQVVKEEEDARSNSKSPKDVATLRSPPRRSGRIVSTVTPTVTKAKTNGHHKEASNSDDDESDMAKATAGRPMTLKKVMFRVKLPKPLITAPGNIPGEKKYPSFDDFLHKDESEPILHPAPMRYEDVVKEAAIRNKVKNRRWATESGKSSATALARPAEPDRVYAHQDHLLAHVCHLRTLMRQEYRNHRKKAEILAYEAKKYVEEKLKKGRVKTAEEVEAERVETQRNLYRAVVRDVGKLWQAVELECNAVRMREYEEEQQAKLKGHLNRVLDRTNQMLIRQDTEASDTDVDQSGSDPETENDSRSEDSDAISASSSETESEAEAEDHDAEMTVEELKEKYQNLPETEADAEVMVDQTVVEEVETPADESDPETEMDSEFDTEDSDQDEDDDEDEEDNGSGGGLLSLFSKKEIAEMAPDEEAAEGEEGDGEEIRDQCSNTDVVLEKKDERNRAESHTSPKSLIQELPDVMEADPAASPNADHDHKEPELLNQHFQELTDDLVSQEHSVRTSPPTSVTKLSEPESASSVEPRLASRPPSEPKSGVKTPVPPLLRGTLREYQHEGLDWLANLYSDGRSGILADEMGLGKTIQSIALLAHLATTYGVWGPHLIVVPTSVMLNWEMEFKKFLPGFKVLTYYGNLEERKQKRRGWMAEDSFNVCITSYQLVLQDANSFKRRRWHYMILDEAHNIKNFRSERWQTMMTFNTRARLLLTGTPLQNNLTELWSLLFFLHYGMDNQGGDDAFAGLSEWSEWFKKPVQSILEHGTQTLDQEDREQVAKLHKVIRPFLLRRLKADVEKQMPLKYEHVEMCRLSKRQRQLYDGFMSRTQTKETLASGNYLSIINALMQLRKVCNHPDLFETRPINTSFTMPKSVAAEYEINDFLVRRRLFNQNPIDVADLDFLQLVPISNESMSMLQLVETSKRHAYRPMKELRDRQWQRVRQRSKIFVAADRGEVMSSLETVARRARLQSIDRTMYYEAYKHHQHPVYGTALLEQLDVKTAYSKLSRYSGQRTMTKHWATEPPLSALDMVHSIESRSRQFAPLIEQYACVTPSAVATDMAVMSVTEIGALTIQRQEQQRQKQSSNRPQDPFHQSRTKLSIAFPDKRLLQYDCGKLQRLDRLLRRLQSGGHRALIFTQMTKVLDILEQFLNIHGHRYLRLDGATKIEQRQILTDRFNNDTRILCFILSSRSGGLGINLTGADTVIFYDLDWNPAMDKQCTDRAHRIGQTRDVHIYRFVSEHTIESNILRKASQKQLLDDVVIQEGDFTTDYLNKLTYRDMLDENGNAVVDENDVAGAAMDRVLGNNDKNKAFEHVEDKEDIAAARVAAKEVQHADDGDFEDQVNNKNDHTSTPLPDPVETSTQPQGPFGATDAAIAEADHEREGRTDARHIDTYLLRLQRFLLRDAPLPQVKDKSRRGKKKPEQRTRRTR